jgi:hypothetical protein
VAVFLLPTIAAAQTLPANQTLVISAETGETYIQWSWISTNSTSNTQFVDIYLDDSQNASVTNYTSTTYISDHLSVGSKHNIALYNTTARLSGKSELIGKASSMTLNPAYEACFLIAVCVFLIVICLFIQDLLVLVLISIINIILCMFGMAISLNLSSIPYLFIGSAIIAGIILLVNGLPKLREELAWF